MRTSVPVGQFCDGGVLPLVTETDEFAIPFPETPEDVEALVKALNPEGPWDWTKSKLHRERDWKEKKAWEASRPAREAYQRDQYKEACDNNLRALFRHFFLDPKEAYAFGQYEDIHESVHSFMQAKRDKFFETYGVELPRPCRCR